MRATGGDTWVFGADGRPRAVTAGPGSTIRFEHAPAADGTFRLVRLQHERGRWVELTWEDAGAAARVCAARSSDGRAITYTHDDAGRLTSGTGPLGTREYRWDDTGRIAAVVDADGVVEAEHGYDGLGRVTWQRSPLGRLTRFAYLPGRVTVVSDADGTRANTWIADERGRLVGVVDAAGQRQSTGYDAHGNPLRLTERDGSVTVQEYDDRGRLTRRVTPEGADLRLTYDDLDRLRTVGVHEADASGDRELARTTYDYAGAAPEPSLIVDGEGGRTALTWDDGLLTRIEDSTGVPLAFGYDDHGDLVAVTDARGRTARLDRDAAGRVVAAVSPSSRRTSFGYTPAGLPAWRRDPDGTTWTFEHTAAGRPAATIDPTGARTRTEHGPHGLPVTYDDPLGQRLTCGYDDLGNLCRVERPDGTAWQFEYDALSRLVAATDPLGGRWQGRYSRTGELTDTVDPTGAAQHAHVDRAERAASLTDGVVTFGARFDRLGRLVAAVQPDGSTVLTRYDRCGRPVEQVDEAGAVTSVERDAAGRVVALTRPSGARLRYAYDACGRLAAVVDELGGRTEFAYDADGRPVRATLPSGEAAWTTYDACGRRSARSVPGQGTTHWRYDGAGRVSEVRDPWSGRRRFGYDAAGRLISARDGNGHVTRYEHDPLGRLITVVDPLGGVTRYGYDAADRRVVVTDPLGRRTRAGYDAAGRQVWQEDATGTRFAWTHDAAGYLTATAVDGHPVATIALDVAGRRLTVGDHTGTAPVPSTLAWDACGLLVERARDEAGLRWAYDADGETRTLYRTNGTLTTYARDAAGRVVGVDHAGFGTVRRTRDAVGRVVAADADGLHHEWRYADGFLSAHLATATDGTVTSHTQVHREDGRIVALTSDGITTRYGYDGAGQLVSARRGDRTTTWSYDANGRLVRERRDGWARDVRYDAAGQLRSVRTLPAEPDAGDVRGSEVTFGYDATGRRTGETGPDGGRAFGWSPTGTLTEIVEHPRTGPPRRTRLRVDAWGELASVDGLDLTWDATSPYDPQLLAFGATDVVSAGPLLGVVPHPGHPSGPAWAPPGWRPGRATDADDPWAAPGVPPLASGPTTGEAGPTLGAAGTLGIAGLELLGARAYDPATRAFLSTDPLPAVPGEGWSANP